MRRLYYTPRSFICPMVALGCGVVATATLKGRYVLTSVPCACYVHFVHFVGCSFSVVTLQYIIVFFVYNSTCRSLVLKGQWRYCYFGLQCHVDLQVNTSVSEEPTDSIFRVERKLPHFLSQSQLRFLSQALVYICLLVSLLSCLHVTSYRTSVTASLHMVLTACFCTSCFAPYVHDTFCTYTPS